MSPPQLRGTGHYRGHRGAAGASWAWCACCRPSARASWLRLVPRPQTRNPGTGGIEPLAKRSGARAMRAAAVAAPTAPLGQRGAACPSWDRTIRAMTVTRNAQPSCPRPGRACPAATRRDGSWPASSGRPQPNSPGHPRSEPGHATPTAVTAATGKTSLQITCPRRSPGAAAVTAKTPKFGLEITADRAHRWKGDDYRSSRGSWLGRRGFQKAGSQPCRLQPGKAPSGFYCSRSAKTAK
jgi:hypothetical protein